MFTGSGIGTSSVGIGDDGEDLEQVDLPLLLVVARLEVPLHAEVLACRRSRCDSSRISTSFGRSMPLSLATWSRMRFRFTFCCMAQSFLRRSASKSYSRWALAIRSCGMRWRTPSTSTRTAPPSNPRSVPVQCLAPGRPLRGPGDGTERLHVHALAGEPRRSRSGLPERPVETGRADLEVVGGLDEVLDVEDGLDGARHEPGSRRRSTPPGLSMKTRSVKRPPPRTHSTSTSSYPSRTRTGSSTRRARSTSDSCPIPVIESRPQKKKKWARPRPTFGTRLPGRENVGCR